MNLQGIIRLLGGGTYATQRTRALVQWICDDSLKGTVLVDASHILERYHQFCQPYVTKRWTTIPSSIPLIIQIDILYISYIQCLSVCESTPWSAVLKCCIGEVHNCNAFKKYPIMDEMINKSQIYDVYCIHSFCIGQKGRFAVRGRRTPPSSLRTAKAVTTPSFQVESAYPLPSEEKAPEQIKDNYTTRIHTTSYCGQINKKNTLRKSVDTCAHVKNVRDNQISFVSFVHEGDGKMSHVFKPSALDAATRASAASGSGPAGGGDEFDAIEEDITEVPAAKGEPQKRRNEAGFVTLIQCIYICAQPTTYLGPSTSTAGGNGAANIPGAVFVGLGEPKTKQSRTQQRNARRKKQRQAKTPLYEKSLPINDPDGNPLTLHQWREMRVSRYIKYELVEMTLFLNDTQVSPIKCVCCSFISSYGYIERINAITDFGCHMDYGSTPKSWRQVSGPRQAHCEPLHVGRRNGSPSREETVGDASQRKERIWSNSVKLRGSCSAGIQRIQGDHPVSQPRDQSQDISKDGEERTRYKGSFHDHDGYCHLQSWRRAKWQTLDLYPGQKELAGFRWVHNREDIYFSQKATGRRETQGCPLSQSRLGLGGDHQRTTEGIQREVQGMGVCTQHSNGAYCFRTKETRRRRQGCTKWLNIQCEHGG